MLQGVPPLGCVLKKPYPQTTILDQTGNKPSNREITLRFDYHDVRGGQSDKLTLCLPDCVTATQPINIKLSKRMVDWPDQQAKVNVNYKWFSFDVVIPANTNCINVPIQTLVDNNSDIRTLWLTGTAIKYRINSDKVNIVTPKIVIPNAFTPDATIHRTWDIHNLDLFPNCSVKVFNRWGHLVFTSTGYPQTGGWDGTFQGHPLTEGAYYYIIKLKGDNVPALQDGQQVLKGPVAIIR